MSVSSRDAQYSDDNQYPGSDEDYLDIDDAGDAEEEIEINIEDYLRAARRPVEVTRKNKLICSISFAVLIVTIAHYVGGLVYFHVMYDIMENVHFKGPTNIIYVLMFTDVAASSVGIWTCLKKTGPQPMIYACIWLLLSSLINLCVTISLTFETNSYRKTKDRCSKSKFNQCKTVTIYLWCSLLFLLLKVGIIILCRFNYPQVFNWMMGKDVYVDEELIPGTNNTIISNAGSFGAAYFDPPDLARIAARGSIKDASVVGALDDSQAVFVTKEERKRVGDTLEGAQGGRQANKRRSTFVTL